MATRPPRILPRPHADQRLAPHPSLTSAGERDVRSPRRQPRIASCSTGEARPVAQADATACQRRLKRRPTALPGLITFRNLRLELPCTISDLSGSGARLTLLPSSLRTAGDLANLPDKLMLVLRTDRMEVPCEVRWREKCSMGVRFLGAPQPIAAPRP